MEDIIQNGVKISPSAVVPKRGRKPLPESEFRDILHKVYNNIFEESVCSDLMDLFGYKVYSDLSKRLIQEEAVRRKDEIKELRIRRRTNREGEPEE